MPRATDIMPITAFTRAYQKVLRDLKKHGRPTVLTVDGKPSAVILDAAAYEHLMDAVYMDRVLLEGLADERPRVSIDESRRRISELAKRGWKPEPRKRPSNRAA